MPLIRRFGLLCAVGVGAAALAGPVFAARDPALDALPNTTGTPHFLVHYQSDPLIPAAATENTAGWIASEAERALAADLADGYTAPVADGVLGGDARTDIYIADLTGTGALGLSFRDTGAAVTSGYILLDGQQPESAFTPHVVSHELFHMIQFGIWATGGFADDWLYESSAEWMGYRSDSYDTSDGLELGPEGMTVDCSDPNGLAKCDLQDPYANGGYSRWGFMEYLSEKFGPLFMQDVFTRAGTAGSAITGLINALVAKGTTLADVYNAWATADMSGGYTVPALEAYRPLPFGSVSTGSTNGTFLSDRLTVNHLATEYISFTRGDDDDTNPCFAATLSITVSMPAGTLSKPAFFWDVKGSTPVQLTVNGSTASASIPWDTCTWLSGKGYLSIPNASLNVDGAEFGVTASLAIDQSQPVTATPPPDMIPFPNVITSPSAATAPTIEVFGPEVITLAASTQQIRLIVSSSGEGSLQAQLGSLLLGTQKLRAGNNDVRFAIPASTFTALRRSSAASDVLTLTPTSPNGSAMGAVVTRKISVTPATFVETKSAKAKAKAKAKKMPAKKKTPAKKTKSGIK